MRTFAKIWLLLVGAGILWLIGHGLVTSAQFRGVAFVFVFAVLTVMSLAALSDPYE